MNRITVARARLERANGLPAILDAAYNAFEDLLAAIQDHQDRGGGTFAAFVMAGTSAANGRHALAAAPSLPPAGPGDDTLTPAAASRGDIAEQAAVLAGLSQLLARRLADAGALSADAGDQAACAHAARYAAAVCSLLGGMPEL